ncbi:hypothetical protein KUTeg_006353 [Tegillarca granosa]|uniref:G-protein coupled receptors family 1 profile domain-containing protein n=1 Tax=Tegillarca granosa TaxID=220873 RepID=A0ABQ9FGB5_TEGGR|nr:hypothetical protein KUTeg_006353 [Tegillarca granosa]
MSKNVSSEDFPKWAHYSFAFPYFIAVIVAIIINGMAIYVFIKRKQLRCSANIFVMCLCLTDLLMAGMAGPLVVFSAFAGKWLFHEGGCVYYAFIVCLMSYTNIGIVTAIAVDRYVVIVRGKRVTLQTAWWVVIGCIMHSFLWSVAPVLGWSSYTLEGMQTSCSINWQSTDVGDISLSIALLFWLWLLPIFHVHKNTVQKLQRRKPKEIEKDIVITSLMVIVSAWAALGDHRDIHQTLVTLPHLSVKFSMVINPIIYLKRNRQFKKAFLAEFPFLQRIKCFHSKVAPAEVQKDELELRQNPGRFQPRGPTLGSGSGTHFCVFEQSQFTSSEFEQVEVFKKRTNLELISEEDNQPVPSTSKFTNHKSGSMSSEVSQPNSREKTST